MATNRTKLFKDLKKAKVFIAGRAFVGENGEQTVDAMRAETNKYW